jgi:hypothetical protein
LLSPPVSKLPLDMRTPSPGLRKFAPMQFSPEAEAQVEPEQEEEEKDWGEVEVEYAGASARNYGTSQGGRDWFRRTDHRARNVNSRARMLTELLCHCNR